MSIVRIVLAVLALVLLSSTADAAPETIAAIEVRSLVARSDRDLVGTLRASIESELAKVDLSGAPKGTRLVLAASLVKLETTSGDKSARAACRVSITLRDAKRGALRAILDGSALAEDASRGAVERGAIEGAVQGAMRGISAAVRSAD